MLKLNDFILLKAIFNEELNDAVLSKDAQKIDSIITTKYEYELNNGFIIEPIENIDTELLFTKHNFQLEHDDFKWAE